jgi:hypothetical protein
MSHYRPLGGVILDNGIAHSQLEDHKVKGHGNQVSQLDDRNVHRGV